MPTSSRWKIRPEGSTWGDFGPDDELGRLNLLTPEKVRQGIAEAREGLVFCLSLPLDYPGGNALSPHRHPPVLRPTLRHGVPRFNYRMDREHPHATDIVSDDAVILHTQYSTQWDGLSHVGQLFDADGDGIPEPVYYNGFRAGIEVVGPSEPGDAGADGVVTAVATSAAKALGIDGMAATGVQGRGVLIDLHAHVGREPALIGYDRLMRILEADKVAVETGDMVCLHTGYAEMLLELHRHPAPGQLRGICAALDGRDARLRRWVTDSGLAALAADNSAVERLPAAPDPGSAVSLPLHEHCLFRLGVHLGEMWHLTPLARWLRAHGRNRFLLTAPPLRLPGAVGSPATPVATV